MSNDESKRLLQEIFDQLARGNPRAMSDAMADDVRWVFPGDWSWAGRWEGKRAVVDGLLRPLMTRFDCYRSEATVILADGDRVVVQAQSRARTKRGDRYDQTYCFVFRVADGRIAEVIEHCDTALVERVLGPPPDHFNDMDSHPLGDG
jgi:ketosteroid isomerase-like protein